MGGGRNKRRKSVGGSEGGGGKSHRHRTSHEAEEDSGHGAWDVSWGVASAAADVVDVERGEALERLESRLETGLSDSFLGEAWREARARAEVGERQVEEDARYLADKRRESASPSNGETFDPRRDTRLRAYYSTHRPVIGASDRVDLTEDASAWRRRSAAYPLVCEAPAAHRWLCRVRPGERVCLNGRARVRCLEGAVSATGYLLCADRDRSLPSPWVTCSTNLRLRRATTFEWADPSLVPALWTPSLDTEERAYYASALRVGAQDLEVGGGRATTTGSSSDSCLLEFEALETRTSDHRTSREDFALVRDACAGWNRDEGWEGVRAVLCAQVDAHEQRMGPPPVAAVYGGKNSGKSTMAQFMANALLHTLQQRRNPDRPEVRSVAFLETDVGQCEFTPCGMVGFTLLEAPHLGPPTCSPAGGVQLRKWFYGDKSCEGDPTYLDAILRAAVEWYRETLAPRGIPLVINTPGWVQGLGLDTLAGLLGYAAPTVCVSMRFVNEERNAPTGIFWTDDPAARQFCAVVPIEARGIADQNNQRVHNDPLLLSAEGDLEGEEGEGEGEEGTPRQNKRGTTAAKDPFMNPRRLPPEDRRAVMLGEYLVQGDAGWQWADPPGAGQAVSDVYYNWCTHLTYGVPKAIPVDKELGLRFLYADGGFPPEFALAVLEQSLVGLCSDPNFRGRSGGGSSAVAGGGGADPEVGVSVIQDPMVCQCLGLGIVREVVLDEERGTLDLIVTTPLSAEELGAVNVIMHGRVEIPIPFLAGSDYTDLGLSIPPEFSISKQQRSRNTMGRGSDARRP